MENFQNMRVQVLREQESFQGTAVFLNLVMVLQDKISIISILTQQKYMELAYVETNSTYGQENLLQSTDGPFIPVVFVRYIIRITAHQVLTKNHYKPLKMINKTQVTRLYFRNYRRNRN